MAPARATAPIILVGTWLILLRTRALNGFLLGEEAAAHLGVDVAARAGHPARAGQPHHGGGGVDRRADRFRRARRAPRRPARRRAERAVVLPLSALIGASLLAVADLVARLARGDPGRDRDRGHRRPVLPRPPAPRPAGIRAVSAADDRRVSGVDAATADADGAARHRHRHRTRASEWRSSDRTGPASRRCCGSWPGLFGRQPAGCGWWVSRSSDSTGWRSPGVWRSCPQLATLPFATRVEEVVGARPAAPRGPVPRATAGRPGGGRRRDRTGRGRPPARTRRAGAVTRRAAARPARPRRRPGGAGAASSTSRPSISISATRSRRWSCWWISTNATGRRSWPSSTISVWPVTSSRGWSCLTGAGSSPTVSPTRSLADDRIREVFGVDPAFVRRSAAPLSGPLFPEAAERVDRPSSDG